jgi:hypothetical protein
MANERRSLPRRRAGELAREADALEKELGPQPDPRPAGRYDRVMARLQPALLGLLRTSLWGMVAFALGGTLVAAIIGLAFGAAVGAWELGWLGGTVLMNRALLRRRELGATRWGLLAAYVAIYPVLTIALFWRFVAH